MEPKYEFERKYRDVILQCSRCGFCQAVCPVYGATLRPAYNARGKMLLLKEVMDGKIDLGDELIETIFQCTTCASCEKNCPSGVRVPEVIKQARKDMVGIGSCHPAFKGMNEVLLKHTNIYAEDEPEDFGKTRNRKAEYVFFIGCVGAYREDESTAATLNLLDRLKVDYTLIDEVCCSGVLEDLGYRINEDLVKRNLDSIAATGAKTVITGCPYCYRTFRNRPQYGELAKNGIGVIHVSQFLKDFDLGVSTDEKSDLPRSLRSRQALRHLRRAERDHQEDRPEPDRDAAQPCGCALLRCRWRGPGGLSEELSGHGTPQA